MPRDAVYPDPLGKDLLDASGSGGAPRLARFVEELGLSPSSANDLTARLKAPIKFVPSHGGRTAYGYEATIRFSSGPSRREASDLLSAP